MIAKFISCIKWNHYSSFFKLLKHIVWILKFKRNYSDETGNAKHVKVAFEKLDQTDTEETEIEVYKQCQLESFDEETSSLEKCLPFKRSNLISLASSLERGMIRVGGTICGAFVPYYQKHQLINCFR